MRNGGKERGGGGGKGRETESEGEKEKCNEARLQG